MSREMTPSQLIERSIQKKYRKTLWTPFVAAVKRYALIRPGDRIAVGVSGGRDSMLAAKLLQLLRRYGEGEFELYFLTVDPGWRAEDRARVEANAALLGVPTRFIEASGREQLRDALLEAARSQGCGKLALGQHMGDVIETTVAGMFDGGRLETLPPKAKVDGGLALIRPLYCVHPDDARAWQRYNDLNFPPSADAPDRLAARRLLDGLKRDNPDIEKSLFNAVHAVCLDTFPEWVAGGVAHSFLEGYEARSGKRADGEPQLPPEP